jgi:ribosomal protein RSM22 (predicted rRNA methylase)
VSRFHAYPVPLPYLLLNAGRRRRYYKRKSSSYRQKASSLTSIRLLKATPAVSYYKLFRAEMLSLPENLEAAIREMLKSLPASQWMSEAQALSRRYRGEREASSPILARGEEQALAYLAQILPATFAQLSGAITAVSVQAPNWQPGSLLDIGSGPGTTLWAAIAQWPSLTHFTAWEREPAFIKIGQRLAQASEQLAQSSVTWERIDVSRQLKQISETYDLIVIGHVLNELKPGVQQQSVAWAWEHCTGVVLLVEPGTSATFPALKSAREQLLALGARTLAPCPHDHPCPLVDDWCHFPQRLQRPPFQRRAKAALSQWEDCKFAYAAMARFAPANVPQARIIRDPQITKVFAEVRLCTADGIVQHRDGKNDREAFKRTKKLQWGDAL